MFEDKHFVLTIVVFELLSRMVVYKL